MFLPYRSASAVALFAVATLSFAANPAPSATVELSVNPTQVAVGGTVVITGSATNTSKKSEALISDYTITGPCGFSDAYSYSFTLGAQQTRTASVNYTAPACAGTYMINAVLRTTDVVLARTSTSFTAY